MVHKPLAREPGEVKPPRVPESDRNWYGRAIGEKLREPYQDRGLPGADPSDNHVWSPRYALLEIAHDDPAKVVAADDLADDVPCGLDELLRLFLGPLAIGARDLPQPVEEKEQ